MQLVSVQNVKEGDQLGKCLYTADGRLMLKQGMRLNQRMIDGIKRMGQHYIFVEMAGADSAAGEWNWMLNMRSLSEDLLKQIYQSVRQNGAFPVKPLVDWSEHMSGIVAELTEMRISPLDMLQERENLIAHSLNVTFLSMLTGKALGYKVQQLRELAIGCLLHDIGLAVPLDDKLAINHPLIGHDMLRKISDIPLQSLQIVLQHHERVDGRGFPQGLKGREVREAAQICSISSDFDDFMNHSLTKRLPCEGIDFVMSKIDTSYDYHVVRAFLKIFEPYPVGTAVTLTGNLVGTVVETNPSHPCRPVIRLSTTGDRFDLLHHTTFRIERADLANQT